MCTGAPLRSVQCVHRGAVTLKAAPWLRPPNWRRASRFLDSRIPSSFVFFSPGFWNLNEGNALPFTRDFVLENLNSASKSRGWFEDGFVSFLLFLRREIRKGFVKNFESNFFFRCKCLWIENHWSNAAMEKVNKILRLVYIRRSSV